MKTNNTIHSDLINNNKRLIDEKIKNYVNIEEFGFMSYLNDPYYRIGCYERSIYYDTFGFKSPTTNLFSNIIVYSIYLGIGLLGFYWSAKFVILLSLILITGYLIRLFTMKEDKLFVLGSNFRYQYSQKFLPLYRNERIKLFKIGFFFLIITLILFGYWSYLTILSKLII